MSLGIKLYLTKRQQHTTARNLIAHLLGVPLNNKGMQPETGPWGDPVIGAHRFVPDADKDIMAHVDPLFNATAFYRIGPKALVFPQASLNKLFGDTVYAEIDLQFPYSGGILSWSDETIAHWVTRRVADAWKLGLLHMDDYLYISPGAGDLSGLHTIDYRDIPGKIPTPVLQHLGTLAITKWEEMSV